MTYATFKAAVKALWTPSAEFDAQSCHVAWGGLLTLFLGHWWGYWAVLAVVWYAVIKEASLDVLIEDDPFLWSGATDLAFWLVGAGLGAICHFLIT